MTKCLQEHYKETHNISDEQIDNYAQEINPQRGISLSFDDEVTYAPI